MKDIYVVLEKGVIYEEENQNIFSIGYNRICFYWYVFILFKCENERTLFTEGKWANILSEEG